MRLLFFTASWCTACNAIKNNLPSYVEHINVDEDPDTPVKYDIKGLPMFVIVKDNGDEVTRLQTTNVNLVDKWFKGYNS
jgi:thiol-disulfide isomerase/thioredoxin